VGNALRHQTHQAGTGRVGSYRVVGEDNSVQVPGGSGQWSVALHADDGVGDDEVGRHGCYKIHDALLDAVLSKYRMPLKCDGLGELANLV
jgi:hypothetical protein